MTTAREASSLEQVRAPKMADLVARQLRRQIVRGVLSDGDPLPSESEMMAQFGVSRPTLREALRVLESEQLIVIRRGARGGARVRMPGIDVAARQIGLTLQLKETTLADVYAARTAVEQHCAWLLAQRHTQENLDLLWAEVERGEAALEDPGSFIRVHTAFHALVVELAGNETVKILSGLMRGIVDAGNFTRFEESDRPGLERASRKGAAAHRRLVEHIEAGRAEDAEQIWRLHLTEADEFLTGGTAKTVIDLSDYL